MKTIRNYSAINDNRFFSRYIFHSKRCTTANDVLCTRSVTLTILYNYEIKYSLIKPVPYVISNHFINTSGAYVNINESSDTYSH